MIIQEFKVSNENLDKFMTFLDSIDIWNWESEYINPGILDGHIWSLKVESGDFSVSSKGDNNYPIMPEIPNIIYDRLHSAICKLLGEDKADFDLFNWEDEENDE